MLDNNGFNLWAENYNESVTLSDDNKEYPFAAYKKILNEIYNRVLKTNGKKVLDIGFGTGNLASHLYEKGYKIYGQDFSEKMIKTAQEKMPNARLYKGDFTKGLVEDLRKQRYDVIIATYSLHHLKDSQKISFIKSLLLLLNEGGKIFIGDVAFERRKDLESCKLKAGKYRDDEEIYFVYEEIKEYLPNLVFEKYSFCSALLSISNKR
ncbi:class I SAM-dependent methyltransferase [Anaerococcus porci]|uniref:class I SAM-dependent methyltransferase n=1 Tax=Anaerococcus porci TaxID=2652269 RepID=UPI002A763A6C|nr:class I SAM-dependent methyltransferase [Anaerococcus porci]MDY3006484.1 class I SAM-dependent methyltransferase [Anaerococcus porci]